MLETSKRGPALKNRPVGDAEMHKKLLNRELLRVDDGLRYFRNTLRLHFVTGACSVFLRRFYLIFRARRGNTEIVDWIGKFSLLLKRWKDSWMDMLPLSSMTEQQRETQYQADMARLNAERTAREHPVLDTNDQETRDNCMPRM